MTEWFEALSGDAKFYFSLAVPCTLLFTAKLVMLVCGGDSDDGDLSDSEDSEESFRLLSVQSILAFGMASGWLGLALRLEENLGAIPTLAVSTAFGASMLLLNSFLFLKLCHFNHQPITNFNPQIGDTLEVYLAQNGVCRVLCKGKVITAISRDNISQGEPVKVVSYVDDVPVVEKIK